MPKSPLEQTVRGILYFLPSFAICGFIVTQDSDGWWLWRVLNGLWISVVCQMVAIFSLVILRQGFAATLKYLTGAREGDEPFQSSWTIPAGLLLAAAAFILMQLDIRRVDTEVRECLRRAGRVDLAEYEYSTCYAEAEPFNLGD